MCNAWNHSSSCDCGWGGSGGGGNSFGGRPGRNFYDLQTDLDTISRANDLRKQKAAFSVGVSEAETSRTLCWWCGDPVFYHTNGYGDCVLFDSLGHPWQVHTCWTNYWDAEKGRRQEISPKALQKPIILKKTLKSHQLEYLIFAGAVHSVQRQASAVIDKEVAERLGVSLGQMYSKYGQFYELFMENAIVRLRLKNLDYT